MGEFSKGGIIRKAVLLYRRVAPLQIPLYAANACFFLLLALFPGLLLLLSVLRYTPLSVDALARMLSGMLPAAFLDEVQALIRSTYDRSASAVLGISALTALWSAGRGMYGILTGLNAIYGVKEHRGYVHIRLLCILYTLVFLAVLLLTLALSMFAGELLTFLQQLFSPFPGFFLDLRFLLLPFVQTTLFCLMYMFLPGRNNTLRDSLPGALLTAAGWLIFSGGFSVYAEHFGHRSLYGPLSTLALGLLWLYWCMCIVFYGAAWNVLLKNRRTFE